MTAHDSSLHRRSGLLGWLGLGAREPSDQQPAPVSIDRRQSSRDRHLDEIGGFLSYHQLEVNAQTLAIASNYLTGNDPDVVRLIDRRIQAREPVTLDWLEEALREQDASSEAKQLDRLMQRLEHGVEEFGQTSRAAREATSAYHSELSVKAGELEAVPTTGAVITELASITRAMLRRTVEIEKAMLRSEEQTRSLKHRLEETRRSAEEDHLTGLPNRRAFEALYQAEYRAARAAAEPLCVAFCDIDHFKRVNDTHGHDAGDRVLKLVAENLARISNERCHVARHGGEEFVVLFRAARVDDAFEKLDRLRAQLADRRLVNRATDLPIGQVTFSAGIADVFASGDRRLALKAADAALYRAKLDGRNRIMIAEPDEAKPPRIAA
ncbi:GGDEF domain-containing protein [Novosphingobium sp. APW14]|uniref:GGDEF domain-containing protein n=1 Tax=Novosphingobium sp. APW14 TaxID=3077237 RepID=UPI0028DD49E2|nr:GGDEF domain-containing protein [Novosphingobium sp. APW14]MDT9013471.1 GGDEF domain-containing protein [Novosphingobium sp. APW14]